MLPATHRLTRGGDLRRVSRTGQRAGSGSLVVHVVLADAQGPARIGFVVSRAVGNSVVRHRVQRRLRHLCRERLGDLPPGCELVVRALAPSAFASYAELGADLDRCLQRGLVRRPGTVS
ncbi:ribonuclease P protein component [Nocardioides cynanchi]|uniref:ribonuclease P protein component n=1 Tax=Nocardioides cynanchi TaxID=2558918 RepID=UPI0012447346|nr:ribonuclease P protein component [Nocardioides cynanchi]